MKADDRVLPRYNARFLVFDICAIEWSDLRSAPPCHVVDNSTLVYHAIMILHDHTACRMDHIAWMLVTGSVLSWTCVLLV